MRHGMMKMRHYLFPLLLFSAIHSNADEPGLQSGVWIGSIKLPGKDTVTTRVQVRKVDNTDTGNKTRVTMYVDDTPLDFIDLNIRKNTLHFNIDTGTVKKCAMTKQDDGAYAGFCSANDSQDEQDRIALSMRPPKDSQETPEPSSDTGSNP